MSHYKKLVGSKCYLSPCQVEDAEKWAEWENDLAVAVPLGGEAWSPGAAERGKEMLRQGLARGEHVYNVLTLAGDELIGRAMLFDFDQVNQCAMLGIMIGEQRCWRQGYGEEASRLLLEFGFHLLNLHNIMLGVFAFNQPALRCYQKLGFKEIGRRREARLLGGKRYDLIFMDLLASEFPPVLLKKYLPG